MTTVKIKLDTREIDKIAKGLDKNTDDVLGNLAHLLEGEAKERAPYDTGALYNSIRAKRKRKNYWWVHDLVEYGIHQEFGTHKMADHPFMRPAAEKVARDLNNGRTWARIFGLRT